MACSRILFFAVLLGGCVLATSGEGQLVPVSGKPTIVYLVRHAEKVDETPDSPLSVAGRERAKTLAWILRDVRIDAVYSTDFQRTKSTVEPAARARDLDIRIYSPASPDIAGILRSDHRGKTLLVCGHSNTIPPLLRALGVSLSDSSVEGFDNLFMVILTHGAGGTIDSTTLHRLHYPSGR